MSAKLLYNLSDENPNLNKQFGCMNGILQVFYRQHYPARPVSGEEKSLPPGERKDLVGDINMESDKETERSTKKKKKKSGVKEKHRVSSESSSRPSLSSSPRSSSFSSAEVSTAASQFDQPGENLIREQLNAGPMMPFDIKELVKGSINREVRTRREETSAFTQQQQHSSRASMLLLKEASLRSSNELNEGRGMAVNFKESHRLSYDEKEMRNKTGSKLKETPRLSLDSRSSCTPVSHRRSNSSVVAKLMGLEVIADNFDTEQRNENRFCDSPRPMSRVEPTSLQRSRSVGSIKKIPASKFPLEPAPWKQMKAGDSALTIYGEIQKRLAQLEFKKAGKDLRALKQILEAMEKTQQLMDGSRDNTTLMQSTHQPVPAMNFKPSSIVVMKPAAPVSTSSLALPNVNIGNPRQIRKVTSGKQNAMDLTPRPGLYKGQQDSTKSTSPKTSRPRQVLVADSSLKTKSGRSQQQSVSPRRQPKKLGFERQSPPTTPKSEPGKIQRQVGRQQMESASPRRRQEIKPCSSLQQPDERLSYASSNLRTDSNISLGSNVDNEVTSRHQLERNCDFPELQTPKQRSPDFGIKQDRPSLKPLKVTVEQPSPVSVLDAAFDEEDSPSPVRKISLSFKDDDNALRSEESVWIKKPANVCRSIILPENNRGPTQPDSDLLKFFTEEDADFTSVDHKYISEILLASGLLRDLEYSMISIQLNKARLPINPGLFFILEQNKASNMMTLLDNKHRSRGFRQHQKNPKEIIRRKLIFDTVNEILAQRFTAEGCTKPRLTANPITTTENISKGEQLLKTLCLEIDRLQENNSQCMLEDDLIWNELQCQGMNLKAYEGETSGIVLDIERMLFRDLINEVCFC